MLGEPKETNIDFYFAVAGGIDNYGTANVFGAASTWPFEDEAIAHTAEAEAGARVRITGIDPDYNRIEQEAVLSTGILPMGKWLRIISVDVLSGKNVIVANRNGELAGGYYTVGNNQRAFITSVNSAGVEIYVKRLNEQFMKIGNFGKYEFKPPFIVEPNSDIWVRGNDKGALTQLVIKEV